MEIQDIVIGGYYLIEKSVAGHQCVARVDSMESLYDSSFGKVVYYTRFNKQGEMIREAQQVQGLLWFAQDAQCRVKPAKENWIDKRNREYGFFSKNRKLS